MSTNFSQFDADAKNFFENHECISSKKWAESKLKGLKQCDNPYFDKKAAESAINNHPSISVLTSKANQIVYENVTRLPGTYEKTYNETFRTDFSDETRDKLPIKDIQTDAVAAASEVRENFYNLLCYDAPKFTPVAQEPFICINYQQAKIGFDIIEPIVYSAFIIDQGVIKTESWNFFDPLFKTFLDFDSSSKASFNVRNCTENAYLVFVLNRTFQVDNGEDCDKYYRKPSASLKSKIQKNATSQYTRFKGKWNTFAFTFLALTDIRDKTKKISLPKAYLCDQSRTLTAEALAQQLERAQSGKLDQIDFRLSITASFAACGNPNNTLDGLVMDSITPHTLAPITVFSNKLLINLNQVKFDVTQKTGTRSILAELQVLQDGKPVKCIQSRWEGDRLTDTAYSRTRYSEKSPQFEDQFVIELPNPCEGLVMIRFYNLNTKESDVPMQYLANCSFQLSPKHNQLVVKNGQLQLGVVVNNAQPNPDLKPTQNNCATVTTRLLSSIVTNVPLLNPVFTGADEIPSIEKIPGKNVVYSLFVLCDRILALMPKDPKRAVAALVQLDTLTEVIQEDKLQAYLSNYVLELAFRDGANHDTSMHKLILREWANIVRDFSNVGGAARKDLIVMDFLFTLIIKSIVASQNQSDFEDDLTFFVTQWAASVCLLSEKGFQQAQRMNKSFAMFTQSLVDIGSYSAASICITKFIEQFHDNPLEHRVLINFLEQAVNPLLFIAEVVVGNAFIEPFKQLIQKAVIRVPNDPINQIFAVVARTLVYIPSELRSDVAAKISDYLLCFDKSLKGTADQLWAPLAIVSFILKHIDAAAFEAFFGRLDAGAKCRFVDFIHFYMVNTKYSKQTAVAPQPSTENTLQVLEKQFQSVGGSGIFGARTRVGKRNFAAMRPQIGRSATPMKHVYIPSKDLAIEALFGAVNTVDNLLNMQTPDYESANDILYHILSTNICIEITDKLVDVIKSFIRKDIKFLIECRTPPFVLVLKKILSIMSCPNHYMSNKFATILPILFESEKKAYKTNNRSLAQLTRAISLLPVKSITEPILIESIGLLLQTTNRQTTQNNEQTENNENTEQQPENNEQTEQQPENNENQTENTEQQTENNDNTEQQTENNEQPAENTEQQAENTEQPTENTEQPTENTEQQPENNEQPAENTEQKTENNEQTENEEVHVTQLPAEETEGETSDAYKYVQQIYDLIKELSHIYNRLQAIDPDSFQQTFNPDFDEVVVPKSKQNTEMDEYGDLLWERVTLFKYSPDATLSALQILDKFHAANDYKIESIIVKTVSCALLSEYLTLLGLMPKVFNRDHPALSFNVLSPIAASMIAPPEIIEDIPNVPGFCDSPLFCESGLISILYEIADFCQSEQLFEVINEVILAFVPLFEYHQMYDELTVLFEQCKGYYQFLDQTPKMGERLMGKYYRVCFFGDCFGQDNKRMYIYRETKLTNLFNLTNRLEATYSKLLPPGKLDIIKESGAVDTRLLEPDKGYIQITSLNPAIPKPEAHLRQTTFEINSHIHTFYFDTPFMKGSKKLQGSVENQWLRRTFLKIKDEMPSVVKRVELFRDGIENVEYEPIRVSYRQLKERLSAYELAIQTKSISQIQPLLNGSLCVQVNEGPTKMAEVFLGTNLRTKYTEKMRAVFRKFLELNGIALEIHREAAKDNTNFQALQEQMDIGYKDLQAKLSPYLNPQ